jgi:hypothetical protein
METVNFKILKAVNLSKLLHPVFRRAKLLLLGRLPRMVRIFDWRGLRHFMQPPKVAIQQQ